MNLMRFKGTDDAVKLTIRLSAGYCIILTIAFASSTVFLINKIEKVHGQAPIIDRQEEVYEASSLSASDMRRYEYMNHVGTLVTHWCTFDESNYEKNISLALNLIGNKGKELLNEHNDVSISSLLMQENIRYGIRIKDVEINTQTIPVSGEIIFTQTGYRAWGSIPRNIEARFTIYDTLSCDEEDAYGVRIEDRIVRYSEPVESDDANTPQATSPGKNKSQSETSKPTDHGTE